MAKNTTEVKRESVEGEGEELKTEVDAVGHSGHNLRLFHVVINWWVNKSKRRPGRTLMCATREELRRSKEEKELL